MNLLFQRALFYITLGLIATVLCPIASAQAPEMRAMWVSRFEWPNSNQATAKANIDNIMATIAANNFNTVFFQVRGQCDVHYPSPDEPWSNTYNWTNPGWDPLAYAIEKAHFNGLEFHAYVNTHTLAAPVPPANTTPQHPMNLHGPAAPGEQSWMIRNSSGVAGLVDSYYWISPANTEASAWTRKQLLYLVKNYNIDGIHYDRIRSPGSSYVYDAATQRRWNNGALADSNPDSLSIGDFMRSQITRDLRNLQGEILYHKPWIKTSAAPFGIVLVDGTTEYQGTGTQSHHQWFQDSWGWLSYHTLDFMVPQIYWQVGSAHPFESLLADWMARAGGRHIVAGSTTSSGNKTVSALLAEHNETRVQNAHGHCIFSFSSMNNKGNDQWTAFKTTTGVYDQPTTVPAMPWKTSPTVGILTGYVVDGQGNPIVDAKINLAGDIFQNPQGGPYNYLSAHDGFFSILDVAPGANHQLTASMLDGRTTTAGNLTVTAGSATSVTLVLSFKLGTLSLNKSSYALGETIAIMLRDDDLVGAGTTAVLIRSQEEPVGETITLTEDPGMPGRFTGSVLVNSPPSVPSDGIIQASMTDMVTVTYEDADIGDGTPASTEATASVTPFNPLIVESNTPSGTRTAVPSYEEFVTIPEGVWAFTTAKSTAPGLTGVGGRWIGNSGLGASATYRLTIPAGGYYEVAVTNPAAAGGGNIHSPGAEWRITHDGVDGETTGTVNLSKNNEEITAQWLPLQGSVRYDAGTIATVTFINRHEGSANTGNRFNMDAVRFSYVQDVPVAVSGWSVE